MKDKSNASALRIILTALLIDLFAFTMILPLLPRILYSYLLKKDPLFLSILSIIQSQTINNEKLDIVLFGGLIGSLFAFLQFIVSPIIGKLSDKYGRKNILLASMVGNLLSVVCWVYADSFGWFLLSRIIGGLTEGNVQLSIAMISDISTPKDRQRSLALVGICFAIAFSVGPPLGKGIFNILSKKIKIFSIIVI